MSLKDEKITICNLIDLDYDVIVYYDGQIHICLHSSLRAFISMPLSNIFDLHLHGDHLLTAGIRLVLRDKFSGMEIRTFGLGTFYRCKINDNYVVGERKS